MKKQTPENEAAGREQLWAYLIGFLGKKLKKENEELKELLNKY